MATTGGGLEDSVVYPREARGIPGTVRKLMCLEERKGKGEWSRKMGLQGALEFLELSFLKNRRSIARRRSLLASMV